MCLNFFFFKYIISLFIFYDYLNFFFNLVFASFNIEYFEDYFDDLIIHSIIWLFISYFFKFVFNFILRMLIFFLFHPFSFLNRFKDLLFVFRVKIIDVKNIFFIPTFMIYFISYHLIIYSYFLSIFIICLIVYYNFRIILFFIDNFAYSYLCCLRLFLNRLLIFI